MRTFFQKKLWIVVVALLGLGALTVLATSLDDIPFNEAQRYGVNEPMQLPPLSLRPVSEALADIPLWKQLVVWGLVTLLVVLIGMLFSPEMRKRLLNMFLRASLIVLGTFFLLKNYGDRLFGFQTPAGNGGPQDPANTQPIPQFQPPQVSPFVSYLISFAFALLWIVVMWVLYQGWKKYAALGARKPLDEIAHIARSSIRDLNSGRDTGDVIINCYMRMSDVVADKQKLQREIAMTPHEFALRLEHAGLPGDAVRGLTRLFEMVRYGDRKSAPKDVSEAVNCLNNILHYCGETI